MSHFTVMVISTEGVDDVQQQLAPYQENNMGDCPAEYMAFNETDMDERRKEYEEDTVQEFYARSMRVPESDYDAIVNAQIGGVLSLVLKKGDSAPFEIFRSGGIYTPYTDKDGKRVSANDHYFKIDEIVATSHPDKDVVISEGAMLIVKIDAPKEIPIKEKYPDFIEDFMEKYHGEKIDAKTGKYGYWENPNAKWDWYQIGGRWAGMLHLNQEGIDAVIKGQSTIAEPNFSWGWDAKSKEEVLTEWKVDQAIKKFTAWDVMMADGASKAEKTWDKVAEALGIDERGHIKQPEYTWEQMREEIHKGDIEAARQAYHDQPIIQAFRQVGDIGIWRDITDFDVTREEYSRRGANNSISTYAVLLDGKWIAKGEMGWWAISSESKEEGAKWRDDFYESFIEPLPDNALITIVDCHI